ncbi:carotenoid ester lipase precursor [Mycena maculata]|uniref:Carboxylic ester hydrolase n=1 Tax=Mycena maculata TaxID=230809 RepID=A0AAD7HG18_9AGAR|nr:carotenoid ester lipase precursor [Mycena maculata]
MFLLLLALPALSAANLVTAAAPLVKLNYGVFQGVTDGNLSTFLGIPFAQPAYAMRFESPKVPVLAEGLQNATAFGAACPQQAQSSVPLDPFAAAPYPAISEDCLTLNVFKPASLNPQSKLPVFVWIYGGGFEFGNSADTDVRPVVERSIVLDEPIIIVTPNYRLSAFGFLAGKEVGDAGISNLGLRDQIFALEWIQAHISAFGGDPERVVIGGPSAGAISVGILLLTNNRFEQSSLFRGAFMLSGSPTTSGSLADGQPDYDGLVEANNCTQANDTLECLRRVPFEDFMATVNHTTNLNSYSSLNNIWRPRVDGDVVLQNPLISVMKGLYAKLPIMTGDSDDEGTVFSLSNTNITTNDEFLGYVHSNYLPGSTAAQIVNISQLYPDDPTQGAPFNTGTANELTPEFKRLAAFQGDYTFIGARRFFLERASTTQDAWSWLNKRQKSTPVFGAFHGSDLPIWFLTENATDPRGVDAMVNFINTLDPNRASSPNKMNSAICWPKWNTPSPNGSTSLMLFSDPDLANVASEDFRVDAIQFLYELLLEQAA